jgi:hypothetical protein
MSIQEYLKSIGISEEAEQGDDNSYVVSIMNSNEFGKIFSKLENAEDLDPLEDNQVVTEQGSSLVYESISEPYMLNLIADFDGDVYSLIINYIGDKY